VTAWQPGGRRPRHVVVRALRILVVAFFLNWIWEATHAAAYVESTGPFLYRLRHCLPMAVTDALWTLALWAMVTAAIQRPDSAWHFAALAALGAVSAVAVERVALAEGRWTYNALMPIVPIVDVGLWPVAQMTVLPVITVWLARARPTRQPASDPTGRFP
jgi:hypothetical protein